MAANKKYKDSVFTLLFNQPKLLLELTNAVLGTNYGEDTPITVNTLSGALFWGRKNDISFLIGDKPIVLIEHQSTINANMPLRFLIYIARLYEKIVDKQRLFKPPLITLPQPEFIVLYNGTEPHDDKTTQLLSSAFRLADGEKAKLELSATVLNVNAGHNPGILAKSPTLSGYAAFIAAARKFVKKAAKSGHTLEEAITTAVKYCIKNNILANFLREHSTEVIEMSLLNWTVEDEKAYSEAVGMEKGQSQVLELLEKGLSLSEIKYPAAEL
jgi:hypothetical protein